METVVPGFVAFTRHTFNCWAARHSSTRHFQLQNCTP